MEMVVLNLQFYERVVPPASVGEEEAKHSMVTI